jgi:hypothetical protein
VEQTFVNKDGGGHAEAGPGARHRHAGAGAVCGAWSVGEYAPNTVKKTVVGVGHARQGAGRHMVRVQLPGVELAGPGRRRRAGHRDLPRPSRAGAPGSGAVARRCAHDRALAGGSTTAPLDHVLIDVRGVGYIVYCSDRTLAGAARAPGERWRSIPICWCARI